MDRLVSFARFANTREMTLHTDMLDQIYVSISSIVLFKYMAKSSASS